MHLKFIIDTQLPPSLTKLFNKYSLEAIHTTSFHDGHLLNDVEIIKIALSQNRIIVSKDKDFFENFIINGPPPKILLIETGNIKNRELFQLIEKNIRGIIKLYKHKNAGLVVINEKNIAYY